MPITLLRPREVAETLQIDLSQVYKLVKSGKLVGVRFGGTVRIDQSSLKSLIERGRTDATS